MMKYCVMDRLTYNAEQVSDRLFVIHLSNGKQIEVEEQPVHNGNTWAWRVDTQIFDKDGYALEYLRRLVTEKLTGIRIIEHQKFEVPDICGIDGRACRCPGKCNTMLCSMCPVAEKFFADRDGVKLVYAV